MCQNNNSTSPPNHNKHVSLQTLSSTMMIKQERREEQEEEEEEENEDIKPTRASLRPKRAASTSSRKSTRRRKKPKYLSLRSPRLSAPNDAVRSSSSSGGMTSATRRGQQLNLFPLKPEQSESEDGGNVAMLFESDGGATLTGLLTAAYTAPATTASTVSSDQDYCEEESEKFPNYPYQGLKYSEAEQNDIVRTAMRRPSRDLSGEKWICYSELVEKKEEIEFPTSSASTCCSIGDHADQRDRWIATAPPSLALKLDYEEILNAWSDKGSLFVHGEPPQTVPDLLHDSNFNADDLWRVPEQFDNGYLKRKIREASVLRYKEKRKKRLYSKQIRYEVRKLNAEKRPRMRGRFVKKD